MNKDKSNSEHTDPENTNGGTKSDNGKNQQTSNKADDKFSTGKVTVNIEDQIFAKIEMKKLTQLSSVKLNKMKSRISEYQAAKVISDEEASQTEIGILLNNPDVWGVIANKILS